jgi:hypothetical protein
MVEAASTSETPVDVFQTTRHKEDSRRHSRRRKKLKYREVISLNLKV